MRLGKLYKAGVLTLAILLGFSVQATAFAKEADSDGILVSDNALPESETVGEMEEEAATAEIPWDVLGADTVEEVYKAYKAQFDNAPLIRIGEPTIGHGIGKESWQLYKIEIPESGKLFLDCGNGNRFTGLLIHFDPHYKKWDTGILGITNYFSEKGTYFIAMNAYTTEALFNGGDELKEYYINTSFVPISTDEQECNDTFDMANAIEMNKSFVTINDNMEHNLSKQYEEQMIGDYDYVKFYFPGGDLYIYDLYIYSGNLTTPFGMSHLENDVVVLLNENKEFVSYDGKCYSTGGTGDPLYLELRGLSDYDSIELSMGGFERLNNYEFGRQSYKNLPAGTYYLQQGFMFIARETFVTDNSDWDFWLSKSKYALQCLRGSEDSEYWINYTPVYVDAGQVSAFVNRLYDLCFGRQADETGYADWNNALLSRSQSAAEVARGFFFSDEMKNRNLTDEEFVELLYLVMMNRSFDEGGKQYWMDSLTNGVSREFVYHGFAESQEFSNLCNSYGIERGTVTLGQYRDKNMQATGFIARLYTKMLGRSFDEDGLEYWCKKYLTKENTIEEIAAHGFLHSEELTNFQLNDEEFVRRMYQTFLNREPEEAGLQDWIGRLGRGEETRDSLVYGFTNSKEFANLKAEYNLP